MGYDSRALTLNAGRMKDVRRVVCALTPHGRRASRDRWWHRNIRADQMNHLGADSTRQRCLRTVLIMVPRLPPTVTKCLVFADHYRLGGRTIRTVRQLRQPPGDEP